jgi:hypothetical protein
LVKSPITSDHLTRSTEHRAESRLHSWIRAEDVEELLRIDVARHHDSELTG